MISLTLAIILLGLGLAFIVAEILFPSFGVLSVLATASIIGSVAVAFVLSSTTGMWFLLAVAVLVPTTIVLGFKVFPKTPMGRALINPGLSFDAQKSYDPRDVSLIGKAGVAETILRPAGIARFDDRRVDVVTRGEMIQPGAPVRVLEVDGNRVVVTLAESPESKS
ncbi:MAG: serine protease [Planctomycetes bacterium]|nr:serine protease [Planctomycetota bacterium]